MIAIMIILFLSNVFWFVGFMHSSKLLAASRQGGMPKALPPPKPICECKHGKNYHSDKGCNVKLAKSSDNVLLKSTYTCPCVSYVGPEPLPEYYHPLEIGN